MLRATRTLLRPGGRTVFTAIHLPRDLPSEQRRRAIAAGPSAVATRSPSYAHLLRSAGFVDVGRTDVTANYRELLHRWMRHALAMEDELAEAEQGFDERIEEQAASRAAVDDGLLRRSLFVARRTARRSTM